MRAAPVVICLAVWPLSVTAQSFEIVEDAPSQAAAARPALLSADLAPGGVLSVPLQPSAAVSAGVVDPERLSAEAVAGSSLSATVNGRATLSAAMAEPEPEPVTVVPAAPLRVPPTIAPKASQTTAEGVDALAGALEQEKTIRFYDITFETNKKTLRADAMASIALIAAAPNDHPSLKVIIEGHTDDVGDENYNLALSQARAEAVVTALVNVHKIAPERLLAVGKGEAEPIASNDAEAGRARNRRVQILQWR